tara:strand:- start:66 stop:419 length:354 start_codon:yes stop_codon:yes gene_type:complete
MNKVNIQVKKEIKLDGRSNNTGRPVNKKSTRQQRLAIQRFNNSINDMFVSGKSFEYGSRTYKYSVNNPIDMGCINDEYGIHVCNVDYIGRTKVKAYTYVMSKRVNVEINLKQVKFVK